MGKLSRLLLGLLVVIPMISGCAAGISRQALSRVTYTGAFTELQAHPLRYQNEVVLTGGMIIETLSDSDNPATRIVILQLPLNNRNQPVDKDQSQGRFIMTSNKFLDPAVYAKGALVTVVGKVVAGETHPIGQMDYLYPVLEVIEIRKWVPADRQKFRFRFGIGIGGSL